MFVRGFGFRVKFEGLGIRFGIQLNFKSLAIEAEI